jgi:hypothetical protein
MLYGLDCILESAAEGGKYEDCTHFHGFGEGNLVEVVVHMHCV